MTKLEFSGKKKGKKNTWQKLDRNSNFGDNEFSKTRRISIGAWQIMTDKRVSKT